MAEEAQKAGGTGRRRPGRLTLRIGIGAAVTVLGTAGALLTVTRDSDESASTGAAAPPSASTGSPRVVPPKILDGPPPTAAPSSGGSAGAVHIPVTPPGKARVTYPDGTRTTWPAPASGRPWVDPEATEVQPTEGGREFASALRSLVPGSEGPAEFGIYQEGSGGRVGSYSATVVDGGASYDSTGAVKRGRFVIARATRGGASVFGSDYDRCGKWPTDGNNLGMEELTPTEPTQQDPGLPTDTLRCTTTRTDNGLLVIHAERSGKADPDHPGSVSGTQREAFTVLPDGTAFNISSSALAATGAPGQPRDWAFLDKLLMRITYPDRA
ncbi:hypothetical protein [Streptomyces sp. NPDC020951]|uniref:hypothetical protein n=1 Tax=Streptomyces sp. NPDC020951 TaxID=3365104 RepID=UPI0037A53C23